MSALQKSLMTAAGALALLVGLPSTGSASPAFTFDPTKVPITQVRNANAPFTATDMTATASDLITFSNNGANFTETGISRIDGFLLNPGNIGISPFASGVSNDTAAIKSDFHLYLSFSNLTGHSIGGGNFALDTLNYALHADPGTVASPGGNGSLVAATTSTSASFSNSGDDLVLAVGSLVVGDAHLGTTGPSLNSVNTFGICSGSDSALFGTVTVTGPSVAACTTDFTAFFVAPQPFFSLSFDEFNTTQNFIDARDANGNGNLAITSQQGSLNFEQVPEPATAVLFGVGLIGLASVSRGRRRSSQV